MEKMQAFKYGVTVAEVVSILEKRGNKVTVVDGQIYVVLHKVPGDIGELFPITCLGEFLDAIGAG